MRWHVIAIACLSLSALSAAAQDKDVPIYALYSCGDLVASKDTAATKIAAGNYARGYFSAFNIFLPKRKPIATTVTDSTVMLYLEKFCRDNPLDAASSGVMRMANDLSK